MKVNTFASGRQLLEENMGTFKNASNLTGEFFKTTLTRKFTKFFFAKIFIKKFNVF